MFTNITWTNYMVVIILLLAVYYILVGIQFYYHDLKFLASRRKLNLQLQSNRLSEPGNSNQWLQTQPQVFETQNPVATTEDFFQEVEHLAGRLKEAIKEAASKKPLKQEFSRYLQLILKEYPALKTSPFQSAINELITSECAKYGSTILSEDEVVKLWDEV